MTVLLMDKDSLCIKLYVGLDYGALKKMIMILPPVFHVSFISMGGVTKDNS
jgi:hypothetical protein